MTTIDAVRTSRSSPNDDSSALTLRSVTTTRRPARGPWFVCALSPFTWIRRWKERRDLKRALLLIDTPGTIEHAHVRDLMRLGDLCVRGGAAGYARRAYRRAAHLFANDGHGQKSVSLLRQIALLDPYDANGRLDLARGLAEMGRRREAALEYQAGSALLESKLPLESRQLLSLALALDPTLPGARERLEELESTRRIRLTLPEEDMADEMPGEAIPPETFADPEFTSDESPDHASGARSAAWRHEAGSAEFTSDESPDHASGARSAAWRHEAGSAEFTSDESPEEWEALPEDAFVIEPTSLGQTNLGAPSGENDFAELDLFGESPADGSTFEDEELFVAEEPDEEVTVAIELFTPNFEQTSATREYGAAHIDLLVSCAMDTSHASVVIEEEERERRHRRARAHDDSRGAETPE